MIETEKRRVIGRAFAYTSASLVTGVLIYMFTNSFLIYTERPDIIGSLVLAAFALVYLNVSFVLARRFASKTLLFPLFPYLTAFLLVLPAIILSVLTEKFLFPRSLAVLSVVLLAATIAGAWYGIRRGAVRYHARKAVRKGPELSGDLKRPHNHISRN